VGRYEIRRELGRGAMGVVYEAFDPALGRTIALKTILPAVAKEDRAAFEERFFTEARIAARLTHPGIVVVHDVGRDAAAGTLYIALEYLQGRTLADISNEGARGWAFAFGLGAQVARGLHHAHLQGIVHRDMKPANVMVLPSGQTKIMDFGIARAMADTARFRKLASPGEFLGTPLYTAPEQATADKTDGRADVFSLGSILYTLITGEPAFAAESIPEIVRRVVHDDPVPPSRLASDLPPDAERVLWRAMAKDPADRYPDAEAFAEDLEDVLAGRPPRSASEEVRQRAVTSHAATWPGNVELVVAEDPVETAFHALVSEPAPGADTQPGGTSPSGPAGTPDASVTPRSAATHPSAPPAVPRRRTRRRYLVLGGVFVLLAGFGLGRVMIDRAVAPPPAPRLVAPTPTEPAAPPATAPASTDAPASSPAPVPAHTTTTGPSMRGPSKLRIEFEHPLKETTLRVWVDDGLRVDKKLTGEVERKAFVLRQTRGTFADVLEVPPGWHDVKIQVAWEDNQKTAHLLGQFRPGATLTLEANLGRLRKDLDLQWKK
jgi:serine/threonine-protein kinase